MLISRFADGEIEAVAFNLPFARSVFVVRRTPGRRSFGRRDSARRTIVHHDCDRPDLDRRNG